MPPGYNSQQKSAIANFISFTNADRNTAIKHLKNHNWNQEAAVNGFFSSGSGSGVSSATQANLNKLFDKYRDEPATSPDTIGAEGSMKYLQDLGADLEGLDALAAHEIVQAPAMGELTRKEFVEGWSGVNCDSIEKQKQYLKNVKTSLPSSVETFTRVYTHTFQLAKGSGNQKAVPLEMATEYWNLLFTHQLSAVKWSTRSSPWAQWWTEFLTTEWKRSINKDIWNQTLKFAQLTLQDEALSFWSEEASWPSVIDEFVGWVKKEKRGITENEDAMEE